MKIMLTLYLFFNCQIVCAAYFFGGNVTRQCAILVRQRSRLSQIYQQSVKCIVFFTNFATWTTKYNNQASPSSRFLNNMAAEIAQTANQQAITNAHQGHITTASKPHIANASNLPLKCTMNCGGTAWIGIRQPPKRPRPTILTKISCCGLQEKRYNGGKLPPCRSKAKPSADSCMQLTQNWLPNLKRKPQRAWSCLKNRLRSRGYFAINIKKAVNRVDVKACGQQHAP